MDRFETFVITIFIIYIFIYNIYIYINDNNVYDEYITYKKYKKYTKWYITSLLISMAVQNSFYSSEK